MPLEFTIKYKVCFLVFIIFIYTNNNTTHFLPEIITILFQSLLEFLFGDLFQTPNGFIERMHFFMHPSAPKENLKHMIQLETNPEFFASLPLEKKKFMLNKYSEVYFHSFFLIFDFILHLLSKLDLNFPCSLSFIYLSLDVNTRGFVPSIGANESC